MRWIIPTLLIVSISAYAQNTDLFQIFGRETSDEMDAFGYLDPEFKWNMEGRVQAELNEGINFLKEGKPNLALAPLEGAIKLDNKLWVAFYYKGVALKQMRRYGEATAALILADRINPKNFATQIELAKSFDLLRNRSTAEKYYAKASDIEPSNGLPLYLLGNHYAALLRPDVAQKYYARCLEVDKNMLDAEVKLGLFEVATNPEKTIARMESVLRKDSLHKQALLFHGLLTADKKDKASLKNWNTLIRLNPTNPFFRLIRGSVLTEKGKYNEAFSDFRRTIDASQLTENDFSGQQTERDKFINLSFAGHYVVANVYSLPDDDAALVKQAYCLLFIKKYDEAYSAVSAVKTAYESALCMYLRGLISEHQGEHGRAFNTYNTALKYDNDIIDAHKKRGIYYSELGRWEDAAKDFNEMLRINPEAFYAYRLRGVTRYQVGNYDGAISDFNEYLRRDSTTLEVYGYRGMAHQQKKHALASTYDLLKSRNQRAVDGYAIINGEINKLLAAKDTAKAIWWLDRFVSADSLFANGHLIRVQVLMKAKKWAELENSADRALYKNGDGVKREKYNYALTKESVSYILAAKGYALVEQGRADEAIREIDEAIDINKMNSLAYLSRGKAKLKQKNKSGGLKDLKKAEEMGELEASEILATLK